VIGPGQVLIGDLDLAIREALSQESVLALEERVLRARPEQFGEGIEGEGRPGGSLDVTGVRHADAVVDRGQVLVE
jgi:hypothetical protein